MGRTGLDDIGIQRNMTIGKLMTNENENTIIFVCVYWNHVGAPG
jgi:hypothetical protein